MVTTGMVPAFLVLELLRNKSVLQSLIWVILFVIWFALWPWAADIIGSLYVPLTLKRLPPVLMTVGVDTTVWHMTMAAASEFENGIDLTRAQITFLGKGFYVWETLDDCLRYMPKGLPKGVIAITISNTQWRQLNAHIIASKWARQYWWLTVSWLWRSIQCCHVRKRTHGHLDTRWSRYDVVMAPGLQGRFSSRQILLKNTPAVQTLLGKVERVYYPVEPVSKSR